MSPNALAAVCLLGKWRGEPDEEPNQHQMDLPLSQTNTSKGFFFSSKPEYQIKGSREYGRLCDIL